METTGLYGVESDVELVMAHWGAEDGGVLWEGDS